MEGGVEGTLSKRYKWSMKLLNQTRDNLVLLERLQLSSPSNGGGGVPPELSVIVIEDLAEIESTRTEMDRLWRSFSDQSQRDRWRRKTEQVTAEADLLKGSMDKYFEQNQRRLQEARERAEVVRRAKGESSYVLRIYDDDAQAMQSVRNSARELAESNATGVAILSRYAGQRECVKRIQRKALDVVNTVGLSSSSLRFMERRVHGDKWVKYLGMILVVLLIAILMWLCWVVIDWDRV